MPKMFEKMSAKTTFLLAANPDNHNKQKSLSPTLHISGDSSLTTHPLNNIISVLSQPLQPLWDSLNSSEAIEIDRTACVALVEWI